MKLEYSLFPKFSWLLASVLLIYSHMGSAIAQMTDKKALQVGLLDVDRPPYFWRNADGNYTGIYVDMLETIARELDIKMQYRGYPQARLRMMMANGDLDIEPGIDPHWRRKKEEMKVSAYSDSFYRSKEIWVTAPEINASELPPDGDHNLTYCAVNGFNPPRMNVRKIRFLNTELQILKQLDSSRCDFTIMPVQVFNHFELDRSFNVNISEPVRQYNLAIRLNIRHKDLIPAINQSLQRMHKTGLFKGLKP